MTTTGDNATPTLSLTLANFAAEAPDSWQPLLDRAVAADAAGIDRLVVSDHVVFGERLDEYGRPEVGGTLGGRQPTGPDGHWLEPLTLLSVIAGLTSRVRLATGILIAPLRRPVVLAKTASTLDVLSGGRLDLGVGVGWQREEYEAAGLPFEGRGARLDATLELLRTVWQATDATIEVEGAVVEHIHQMPKPIHPDGVPIWVSGTLNPRVVRRVARFGSGWIPWGPDAVDPTAGISRLHGALAEAGRDSTELEVRGRLTAVKDSDGRLDVARTMERVPAMLEAGITDLQVTLSIPRDRDEATERLASVVEGFRAVAGR